MINRLPLKFIADPHKVLLLFFDMGKEKTEKLLSKILTFTEGEVQKYLDDVINNFGNRHRDFEKLLLKHFELVKDEIPKSFTISKERMLLIGAYFSKEYSIEAASLFNPSIVLFPYDGNKSEENKFIISLRSVGEGHISSIKFLTGKFQNGNLLFDKDSKYSTTYSFKENLKEFENSEDIILKSANYNISFNELIPINERVIFPSSISESNGIEDVRLVRFKNDDNSFVYYGTFTAYDGHNIHPQIFKTLDFKYFEIRTLNGPQANDKDMALFPEKINGKYAMISRQDAINIRIMFSDDLYTWNESEILISPTYGWDAVQMGNCGSPIKTEDGWLLFTHGVGPFRRYVMGAALLDLKDPTKVVSYLNEPLFEPNDVEREGYVPNVVYSCGSILINDLILMPYAMSDTATGFITIKKNDLLKKLRSV